jgi:hypothetical protein
MAGLRKTTQESVVTWSPIEIPAATVITWTISSKVYSIKPGPVGATTLMRQALGSDPEQHMPPVDLWLALLTSYKTWIVNKGAFSAINWSYQPKTSRQTRHQRKSTLLLPEHIF